MGLGLAVAKGLAEAVGVTVDVEDTPGGGLTMIVTVPIAATCPTETPFRPDDLPVSVPETPVPQSIPAQRRETLSSTTTTGSA